MRRLTCLLLLFASLLALPGLAHAQGEATAAEGDTFSQQEILSAATEFFGNVSEGLALVVEKTFKEQGRPNAYIAGEEVSGAIGVGLRYGKGRLTRKAGGGRTVYWQGPSIGFDLGGNAAKIFVLVYHLPGTDALFQRYPGVEGSYYFVAGAGVHYLQAGNIILAPIRTGVGLRAGVNVGYMHVTPKESWIPF